MSSITLRWLEEHLMIGTDSNGHSIVIGRSPDPQFEWVGMKPSDLLLIAVASCSSYDIVKILEKQREPLRDFKVICSGDQLTNPPYSFTHIHIHYVAEGNINPERMAKAIRICEEKYCSVISTLKPAVDITSDYEIIL